jgi:peptidoglycan/LPS O-acetylase OafA/YrhL
MFLLSSPFAPMQTGVFQFLAAALVFPLVVYLGSLVEPPATSVRACIILGELSYPVYLLHDPILSLLYMPTIATLISRSLPSKLLTVLLTLVIASAISYFVGTRLDAPLRKFLSRWYFPRGKQNAPQTPVACLSNTIALQGTHDD